VFFSLHCLNSPDDRCGDVWQSFYLNLLSDL
jgi:hypothetical protein